MSRKREPVAEIGAEDYRIVRHTHDVALATSLMRAAMIEAARCIDPTCTCIDDFDSDPGKPVPVWVRVVPALPNSWAAGEGLAYTFNPAEPHSRGAFPAVEFR